MSFSSWSLKEKPLFACSSEDNVKVVLLYPNPTKSILIIGGNKEYDIGVYDILGNKLIALTGNSINMEHLSTATYIVKATEKSNNEEMTYKVLKNQTNQKTL